MQAVLESRGRKWRGIAATGFALALAVVAVFPLNSLGPLLCPLRRWLGLPCLLCGGTRATQAFLHGQWERAFYLNGWAVLIVVFGGIWALFALAEALTGRRMLTPVKWTPWRIVGCIALILGCWGIQLWSALTTPKPELLNERSLPAIIQAWFSRA